MNVKNPLSQNIRIFPKINRFFFFFAKQKSSSFLKYFHLYTQYLVLSTFSTNDSISEVWHGSDQAVALLRHY